MPADTIHPMRVATTVPQAPPLDPRMVAWMPSQLVPRTCPLCEADQYEPIVKRPDGLIVGRCGCGHYYLPLVPSAEDLATFYAKYSANHQKWQGRKSHAAARKAAGRRRGGNGLIAEIGRRRPLSGSRLMELGCSRGSFLLDAREAGAVVSGMEVDVTARDFLSELGIPCHATLEAVAQSGPYDIIVALNVIEHLVDPKAWLQQLSRMLSSGGLLALWTPNGGQADILGAGWVGFRVDFDHLSYFSLECLARAALQADLWPEAAWEFSQANLGGFRPSQSPPKRQERIAAKLRRAPVRSWSLPVEGGGYTLAFLAGKAPADR